MDIFDLSYLAGLFDGEGSAGVYVINRKATKGHPRPWRTVHPVIQLRMLDAEPVRFFYQSFGGYLGLSKRFHKETGNELKPVYEYRTSHRHALAVAKLLSPWCKNPSKQLQLQKIIDHYATWTRPIKGQIRYPVMTTETIEFDPKTPLSASETT